jgi:hypothetical protein
MSDKIFANNLDPNTEVAIGIDQSLTGFALTAIQVNEPTKYLTKVYKSPYKGVRRLSDIGGWIVDQLEYLHENGNKIVEIAMEGTVLASHSALVLGELSATVKLTLWDYFDNELKTPLQIPPMTLKKYASGKGNSKKQEMLLQMYKRWGVEFNDDNAADSYGLARLAAGIASDSTEAQIVEQIKDPKYKDS